MLQIRNYVWNSLRNYRSLQTDWLSLFSWTHRRKIPNRVFSCHKLTFCSNDISLNVLQQPYISIWILNTYKSFSSFFHFVRRSLENIFLLWICRKHFWRLLTFSTVLLFYILPELEVSWCIPFLQHVLYCFISVFLTFIIETFNIYGTDLKRGNFI